jgi:thioredoxin
VATVALTKDTFEDTVRSNDVVLVDFWAGWCAPCRMFSPVFETVAERHADIVFGKVDTEAEFELAGQLGIMSIPTLMVFRDQILMFSQPGALPTAALEELIKQVKDIDMDDIRRRIEDEARAAS